MKGDFSIKDQCTDIQRYVGARISKLQAMYLSESSKKQAARQLAKLRRSVSQNLGSDAEVWALEFDDIPASLVGLGTEPSAGERAIHIALTLYALHQQSQNQEMHKSGSEFDLGAAVRRYVALNHAENLEDGQLPRRFSAMTTADSIGELAHHARQLVQMLRASALPIDYGRLARQLLSFQVPYLRDGVRLEWGRAYVRSKSTPNRENIAS